MEWIRVQNAEKAFGVRELFKDVSFDVKRGERIGLVGPNGVGKSTLLKCIMGYEELDGGQIYISEGCSIGYLKQDVDLGEGTLREEIEKAWKDLLHMEEAMKEITSRIEGTSATAKDLERLAYLQERFEGAGGYEYEAITRKIIYSLGFLEVDLDTPVRDFSGGQKTRINMAKAIMRHPDFLLLDEPTNHLDMDMLDWLEGYLSSYKGGILIVSHDRYFLDKVATGIVELNHLKAHVYKGNYSRYLQLKAEREKSQIRAYDKQQEYIKRTEEYINKYRAGIKSKMARGRQSQLDRLERLEDVERDEKLRFQFPQPSSCADKVLTLTDVTSGYGQEDIIKDLKLLIRRGESVALIGPNGAGKTTLLKTIMGDVSLRSGLIDVGDRVRIGYFSQEHEELKGHYALIEEIMNHTDFSEEQARNVLGMFLFKGDAVFRRIDELSGGEKARLALLKLFLEGDNFLILDEPTNHLDIPTREIVEEALLSFKGTYLVISHDRYFLDKIAQRTLYLEDGQVTEYLGNYSYYREKVAEKETLLAMESKDEGDSRGQKNTINKHDNDKSSGKEEGKSSPNTYEPKVNDYMREKLLDHLETEIARLEATMKMYEVQLSQPHIQASPEELMAITEDIDKTKASLDAAYEEWERLQL